jgi:polyisoprenoid-binding protein YceI
MNLKIFGILLIILFTTSQVYAQTRIKVNCLKDQSEIVYSMRHPLHEWQGKSMDINSLILTDKTNSTVYQVAVSAGLSTFDSRNANRDSHMMEVTEALKYPNVTFASNSVTVEGNEYTASGTLTFHGISQPVALKGSLDRSGDTLTFTGKFTVRLTQFGINPPTLMGIKTDDEVNLEFKVVYR